MKQYELGRVYTFDEADSELRSAMLAARDTFLNSILPVGDITVEAINECRNIPDRQLQAKYQGTWKDQETGEVLFHQFSLIVPTHCSFMGTTFAVKP